VETCTKADGLLTADISIIDDYARGDETIQFLVSTDCKTIHGNNRGFGFKNRQIGGHLSDLSLHQMSRDISSSRLQAVDHVVSSPDSNTAPIPDDGVGHEFRERYGPGVKLAVISSPAPGEADSPQASGELTVTGHKENT